MTADDSSSSSTPGQGSLPDDVIEERFAAIIAGYDRPGDWPVGPGEDEAAQGGAAEHEDNNNTHNHNVDEIAATHADDDTDAPGADPAPVDPAPVDSAPPTILSIPVWRGATGPSLLDDAPDDPDDDFVPAPVNLPPSEDLHYWGSVIGLVLGPILVLYVAIAKPFYSTWWLLAGLGLCVGGFVLLVLRSPRTGDHEDDDSGARV